MELKNALVQIDEIRAQMAKTQVFRGYRSATAAVSAVLAVLAGLVQASYLPEPTRHPMTYVILWTSAAGLSLLVVGAEMLMRARRLKSRLQSELTMQAVEQFMPALVAGGVLAYVVPTYAPESMGMLPGLWLMVFGLGVFASCRVLPRATFWIGAFYLLAGVLCLLLARGPYTLWPGAMGIPFAVGQILAAGVLYVSLERRHGE
ncbi:MAG: hypothetical protein WCI73_15880 [Phycisphaerae bacterium]